MAGMVLGRSFKQVLSPLLRAGVGLAALESAVDELEDEADYPWEEFTTAVAEAAQTVSAESLVEIGKTIISGSKAEFERWGFDSAEAVLTDLDAPFGAKFIDPPEHERLTTAKYEPGYALFRVGAVHPRELIEGYLRGIVEAYGGEVKDYACHHVIMNGQPYHLMELRWWTPAKPQRRRRAPSGPRYRSVA